MSFIFNNVDINEAYFNGTKLSQIVFNGVPVWYFWGGGFTQKPISVNYSIANAGLNYTHLRLFRDGSISVLSSQNTFLNPRGRWDGDGTSATFENTEFRFVPTNVQRGTLLNPFEEWASLTGGGEFRNISIQGPASSGAMIAQGELQIRQAGTTKIRDTVEVDIRKYA